MSKWEHLQGISHHTDSSAPWNSYYRLLTLSCPNFLAWLCIQITSLVKSGLPPWIQPLASPLILLCRRRSVSARVLSDLLSWQRFILNIHWTNSSSFLRAAALEQWNSPFNVSNLQLSELQSVPAANRCGDKGDKTHSLMLLLSPDWKRLTNIQRESNRISIREGKQDFRGAGVSLGRKQPWKMKEKTHLMHYLK